MDGLKTHSVTIFVLRRPPSVGVDHGCRCAPADFWVLVGLADGTALTVSRQLHVRSGSRLCHIGCSCGWLRDGLNESVLYVWLSSPLPHRGSSALQVLVVYGAHNASCLGQLLLPPSCFLPALSVDAESFYFNRGYIVFQISSRKHIH